MRCGVAKQRKSDAFGLERRLTHRISVLHSQLARAWRHVGDDSELALREWRVLALLVHTDGLTASDLVAHSSLDKASISRAVANLERSGLIAARADSRDGRVRNLRVTAKGKRTHARVAPRSSKRHRALLGALAPSEQRALFEMLDKLIARSSELAAEEA
jgi:DNA-binding MarR family transcriptional regulator